MRDRKPIPKNQAEIVQDTITPFLNQGKPVSQNVFTHRDNRALNTTRKTDKIKDITIGLEDIDQALKYYFENIIKPTVIQDGNRMDVPIIYGSPERWKSVQQDGYYRDTNGKLVLPLIMYKRSGIEKNRNLGNKIDGNLASLFQTFETRYNQRNQYDKFSILNNRIPSKQYYVSVVPDYVTITYDCVLLTNYVEQNNKLIEAIEYAADSYWGDASRWQFRTSLDSFGVTNTINTGEDRVSSTSVSLKVNGYLIADSINQHLSDTNMHYSPAQIIFGLEVVGGVNETFNAASQIAASQAEGSTSFIGGGTSIINNNQVYTGLTPEDLAYLSTNITKIANTVTTSTATFNGTSFLEPSVGSQLPPTSVSNFNFYVNGIGLTDGSITGFGSDGMGNIILTVNVGILGYTLVSTDEVVAIGKFT